MVTSRLVMTIFSFTVRCRELLKLNLVRNRIRAHASNVGIGSGGYEGREENDKEDVLVNSPTGDNSPKM